MEHALRCQLRGYIATSSWMKGITANPTYNISTTKKTPNRLSSQITESPSSPALLVSALYPADQNNIIAFTALNILQLFISISLSASQRAVSHHRHRVIVRRSAATTSKQSTYSSTSVLIVTFAKIPPGRPPPLSLQYILKRDLEWVEGSKVCFAVGLSGPLPPTLRWRNYSYKVASSALSVLFLLFGSSERRGGEEEEEQRGVGELGGGGSIGIYNLYIHLHILINTFYHTLSPFTIIIFLLPSPLSCIHSPIFLSFFLSFFLSLPTPTPTPNPYSSHVQAFRNITIDTTSPTPSVRPSTVTYVVSRNPSCIDSTSIHPPNSLLLRPTPPKSPIAHRSSPPSIPILRDSHPIIPIPSCPIQ